MFWYGHKKTSAWEVFIDKITRHQRSRKESEKKKKLKKNLMSFITLMYLAKMDNSTTYLCQLLLML